jgi:hypothetical protein
MALVQNEKSDSEIPGYPEKYRGDNRVAAKIVQLSSYRWLDVGTKAAPTVCIVGPLSTLHTLWPRKCHEVVADSARPKTVNVIIVPFDILIYSVLKRAKFEFCCHLKVELFN